MQIGRPCTRNFRARDRDILSIQKVAIGKLIDELFLDQKRNLMILNFRFYRCVKFNQGIEDYSVFEFDCPAGLAFDERAEVCVWPGSITEGSACPGSSEIAPSKGHKFTCPEHPGYYADPENCRFFYACYDLGNDNDIIFWKENLYSFSHRFY